MGGRKSLFYQDYFPGMQQLNADPESPLNPTRPEKKERSYHNPTQKFQDERKHALQWAMSNCDDGYFVAKQQMQEFIVKNVKFMHHALSGKSIIQIGPGLDAGLVRELLWLGVSSYIGIDINKKAVESSKEAASMLLYEPTSVLNVLRRINGFDEYQALEKKLTQIFVKRRFSPTAITFDHADPAFSISHIHKNMSLISTGVFDPKVMKFPQGEYIESLVSILAQYVPPKGISTHYIHNSFVPLFEKYGFTILPREEYSIAGKYNR